MDPQFRLVATQALVEVDLESVTKQRPENAELLVYMLGLKILREAFEPFNQDFVEILRIVDATSDEHFSSALVLVVCSIFPGELPWLLRVVVGRSLYNVAKSLIHDYFTETAQEELEWLKEVKDLGCGTKEMLNSLQKSDPWVTSDDANPEGDHPGELDRDLHQSQFVHQGKSINSVPWQPRGLKSTGNSALPIATRC